MLPRIVRWRAIHVVTVPESVATMASSLSSLLSSCATTCGFIGLSLRVPRSNISSFHSFIPFCAASRNERSLRWLSRRQQRPQNAPRVADQAGDHGIAQSDALWIEVDLDRLRLPRLGIKLDVGKRASRDQQRVAILERFP